jgi:hypothetical protein
MAEHLPGSEAGGPLRCLSRNARREHPDRDALAAADISKVHGDPQSVSIALGLAGCVAGLDKQPGLISRDPGFKGMDSPHQGGSELAALYTGFRGDRSEILQG